MQGNDICLNCALNDPEKTHCNECMMRYVLQEKEKESNEEIILQQEAAQL